MWMSSLARTSAPTPFGPPILWADRVSRSAPSAADVAIDAAGRLHRVDMQHAARRVDDRGGLPRPAESTPVSLLASITETSARGDLATAVR